MTKDDFISNLLKIVPDTWDDILIKTHTLEDQVASTEQHIKDTKQAVLDMVNPLLDSVDGIAVLKRFIEKTDIYEKLGSTLIDLEALTTFELPADLDMSQDQSIRDVIQPKALALQPILSAYDIDCSKEIENILVELLLSSDSQPRTLAAMMVLKNEKITTLTTDITSLVKKLFKVSLMSDDIDALKIMSDSALVLAMDSVMKDRIDADIVSIESLNDLLKGTHTAESEATQKALDILMAYKATLALSDDDTSTIDEFTSQSDFNTIASAIEVLRQLNGLSSELVSAVYNGLDTLGVFQQHVYPVTFAMHKITDFDTGFFQSSSNDAQPFFDYAEAVLGHLDTDSSTLLPSTLNADSVIAATQKWLEVVDAQTAPAGAKAVIDLVEPLATDFIDKSKNPDFKSALDVLFGFTQINDAESGIRFLHDNAQSIEILLSAMETSFDAGAWAKPYLASLDLVDNYPYELVSSTDIILFLMECFADIVQDALPKSIDDALGEGGLKAFVSKIRAFIDFLESLPVRLSVLNASDISALFSEPVVGVDTPVEVIPSVAPASNTPSPAPSTSTQSFVVPESDIEWLSILVALLDKSGFFDAVGVDDDATKILEGVVAGDAMRYWQDKYWQAGGEQSLLDKFTTLKDLVEDNIDVNSMLRPFPSDFQLSGFITYCFDFIDALMDAIHAIKEGVLDAAEDTLNQMVRFINFLKFPDDIAQSWPANMFFKGENYNLLCLLFAIPLNILGAILDLVMTAVLEETSGDENPA
ncbi:MAG: hypothetical protein HRU20_28885 [Pseudomonadales bacterium]|nr:hypothetical protein [Pseudomonadales bacterium]